MSYAETEAYLRALKERYPTLVTVGSVGRSVEGREIYYARVSSGGANNPIMLVDALMHAREWITLPPVLYFLEALVQDATLRAGLDVVVVPILNPDGYEYSRTKDRMWRKNRGATSKKNCVGVDLNRNFDYHWADFRSNKGASSDPCELTYAGPKAASEPETVIYQTFIRNLNAGKRVKMYVNIHNPEQSIYLPWGYSATAPKLPDAAPLTTIAKEVNNALVAGGAKSDKIEAMAADYPATGTVSDWVRGVAGVAQSFCMELPAGGPDKQQGFAVPPSSILATSKQTLGALKVFVKYAKKPLSQ
ncbi:carboxypeptidase B-like [Thrips palmi]|nr:carboxypeptidase B-like [Thrips palmi]